MKPETKRTIGEWSAEAKFDRPASTIFHAVTHVWGRKYLDLFLNVCIPNQLAAGNVPALPSGSRYRILTGSIHVEELDTHPMVHALREVIPVDIVVVDALDRQKEFASFYDLQNECHQQAIADILDAHAALIMLSAAIVLSESALAAVVRRHRQGHRAVVETGLRLAKKSFLKSLEQPRARLDTLSSRELIRMALPHLHPEILSMFADAPAFSERPSQVYWRVGSEGMFARCFHLHPLMVDPVRPVALEGTNDDHYLAGACPDFSRVHVVTDSDELQEVQLTPTHRTFENLGGAGASVWQAAMMAAGCDELQLRHWREHPVYLHAVDVDEAWVTAALAGEKFVRRVIRVRLYSGLAWHLEFVGERCGIDTAFRRCRRCGPVLVTMFESLMMSHRRHGADETALRKTRQRYPRVVRVALQRAEAFGRGRRKAMKRVGRPVKLLVHRAAKAGRLGLKRIQRRVLPGEMLA